jgi:hypothetical protein
MRKEHFELIKAFTEMKEIFPYDFDLDEVELDDLSYETLVYNFREIIKNDYEESKGDYRNLLDRVWDYVKGEDKMKEPIYVIRQTQEDVYDNFAFVAYEDYDEALKECARLNAEYGSESHYYEVDSIDLHLKRVK